MSAIQSVLAIDPGACTGWALFVAPGGWRLVAAGVAAPDQDFTGGPVDLVVIERPMRNYGVPEKGLLTLAITTGRYVERYRMRRQELVEPRAWKGTIDGDIMTARIDAALTPAERALLPKVAKTYRHNMLDAIGLGKWALQQPFMRAK